MQVLFTKLEVFITLKNTSRTTKTALLVLLTALKFSPLRCLNFASQFPTKLNNNNL